MFYHNISRALTTMCLLLVAIPFATAAAKPSAKQQSITINSDSLLLDEKNGISKYTGNVVFTKSSLIISADAVTVYFKDDKLHRIEITGSPADVKHSPDKEDSVQSQASQMEYSVETEKLILKGNAFVKQGSRHFSGEVIEYDSRQKTLAAKGNKPVKLNNSQNTTQKNGRVHVIIGPAKPEQQDSNE